MKRQKLTSALFVLALFLAAPATLRACPICSEGIEAAASGDDTDDFPAAMNQSIYLMVAVPYAALGFAGFCIYRGCKKNEAHMQGLEDPPAAV